MPYLVRGCKTSSGAGGAPFHDQLSPVHSEIKKVSISGNLVGAEPQLWP
jgi:hypothetical protein